MNGIRLLGAVVLVGVLFSVVIPKFLFSSGRISLLGSGGLVYQTYSPAANLIISVSPDDRVRETWETLVDLSSAEPHRRAMIALAKPLSEKDLERVQDALKESPLKPSVLYSLYSKCQGWLRISSPTESRIEEGNTAMANKYYESLAGGGPTSILKVYRISESINENIDMFQGLCGEAGCPRTMECAACTEDILEYEEAQRAGDTGAEREIEIRMREKGCAEACVSFCAGIYDGISVLVGRESLDPEVRKAFISTGVRIV